MISRIQLRSAPAQKDSPAPVRTTTADLRVRRRLTEGAPKLPDHRRR